MTARPIRRNAQTPDRNGKIFYTSTTSLSHISKALGITCAELFAAKKDDRQETLECKEVAENALEVFRGKSLEMKTYSVIALILSVVTCCIGIAIVCYYVDSIKMRALLVGLLTLTEIFVSATNGAVFRATRR